MSWVDAIADFGTWMDAWLGIAPRSPNVDFELGLAWGLLITGCILWPLAVHTGKHDWPRRLIRWVGRRRGARLRGVLERISRADPARRVIHVTLAMWAGGYCWVGVLYPLSGTVSGKFIACLVGALCVPVIVSAGFRGLREKWRRFSDLVDNGAHAVGRLPGLLRGFWVAAQAEVRILNATWRNVPGSASERVRAVWDASALRQWLLGR